MVSEQIVPKIAGSVNCQRYKLYLLPLRPGSIFFSPGTPFPVMETQNEIIGGNFIEEFTSKH